MGTDSGLNGSETTGNGHYYVRKGDGEHMWALLASEPEGDPPEEARGGGKEKYRIEKKQEQTLMKESISTINVTVTRV